MNTIRKKNYKADSVLADSVAWDEFQASRVLSHHISESTYSGLRRLHSLFMMVEKNTQHRQYMAGILISLDLFQMKMLN